MIHYSILIWCVYLLLHYSLQYLPHKHTYTFATIHELNKNYCIFSDVNSKWKMQSHKTFMHNIRKIIPYILRNIYSHVYGSKHAMDSIIFVSVTGPIQANLPNKLMWKYENAQRTTAHFPHRIKYFQFGFGWERKENKMRLLHRKKRGELNFKNTK